MLHLADTCSLLVGETVGDPGAPLLQTLPPPPKKISGSCGGWKMSGPLPGLRLTNTGGVCVRGVLYVVQHICFTISVLIADSKNALVSHLV